ncbi:hypothetical protein L6R29_11180 [Myxococcota bacterium]|nr:hypothetical protein [Myxococcota bacterium]
MPPPFFTHAPPSKPANHRYFALFISTLFALSLLPLHSACLPPAPLDCNPCQTDGTCGVNTGFVCKDGYCVSESDPNPARCKTERPDGGLEKTEPLDETSPEETTNPEEATNPEESVHPEDGAPLDNEPLREQEPELVIKETDKPYIARVNGNGTQLDVNAKDSPFKPDKPPTAPSPNRIKDALVIEGALLDQITRWTLTPADPQSSHPTLTWTNNEITKGQNMLTLSFSKTKTILAAGLFLLTGLYAQGNVQAQIFVLQGEKGESGAKGDKGEKGDPGLTSSEQTQLQALLPKLKASGNKLILTADEISFESAAGNEAAKLVIDSAKKELSFSSGTTIFSFNSTQLTATANQVNVNTPNFEIKGANATSLKLDDSARSISLRVTQKNATTQATFSLEGGDANANPVPLTKYPLATFDRTNVQVQSGAGKTDAAVNGLGNLIVGYNEKRSLGNVVKTGSHNAIIGMEHHYSSYGGFVQGKTNSITDTFAGVFGGSGNTASSSGAGVFGGSGNTASGVFPAVLGGVGELVQCGGGSTVAVCQK